MPYKSKEYRDARRKQLYNENKERNRDEINARRRELYNKNPEKSREKARADYKKNREKKLEYGRQWHEANKDKLRETRRKRDKENSEINKEKRFNREYGITILKYNEMLVAQGGVCKICLKPETALGPFGKVKSLSIDHDHETLVVRGLLCSRCNLGIGHLNDCASLLRAAADYLEGK